VTIRLLPTVTDPVVTIVVALISPLFRLPPTASPAGSVSPVDEPPCVTPAASRASGMPALNVPFVPPNCVTFTAGGVVRSAGAAKSLYSSVPVGTSSSAGSKVSVSVAPTLAVTMRGACQ